MSNGGMEDVSHLRGCRLPSVGLGFSKELSIPLLKIITLFRCLKIKGPLKELQAINLSQFLIRRNCTLAFSSL